MASLPWFNAMPPEERSYVGLVVQAALEEFASWLRDPSRPPKADPAIFAAAPRALARAVTLQQTVQLIRVTVEVLEAAIPTITATDADADALEHAVLRYSREVAFAAAEVYAAAAEERGAWDARTEAAVVDALARGDAGAAVLTRASALGWGAPTWVAALAGSPPTQDGAWLGELRSAARRTGLCILVGEYGDHLLAVIGGDGPSESSIRQVVDGIPGGPVVIGPLVPDLTGAPGAVAEARAALPAAAAWPDAPRPVSSSALLAERVVLGEEFARHQLVQEVFEPLAARPDLLVTAAAYLEVGSAVEAAARRLFLHPNTVRYRLGRIADVTGRNMSSARGATDVQVALVLGRGQQR
ncbi:MAG: PucR family transcriptional regulator [Frankiales bacterium]|jgi:hypothetical protein|nr:PucR family transcriptional regulator [Frankiales bacterium]